MPIHLIEGEAIPPKKGVGKNKSLSPRAPNLDKKGVNCNIKAIRIGILFLEGAVILLLTAAGIGLLRHSLPIPGYCTFGAIPLILLGTELIYLALLKPLKTLQQALWSFL